MRLDLKDELGQHVIFEGEFTFINLKDHINDLICQYGVTQIINNIDDSDSVLEALDEEEIKLFSEGL